jgi:sulfur-oxidizing protein SoxX
MKLAKKLLIATAMTGLITTASVAAHHGNHAAMVKEGEKLFHTKSQGNCLACHDINGKKVDNPGSLGPKLTGLKYWDEKDIYSVIYEPYATRSKIGSMPSFGKNGYLTDHQIKALVAYLKTVE